MKSNTLFISLASLLFLLFTACNSEAQNTKNAGTSVADEKIQVIQFHSENRCMTCNKIELMTKETLKRFPGVTFSLINVDDAKNEKKAEQFEAYGTALFLYHPASGKKKELTDFAFMNASNRDKFIEGLTKEINLFQKR